MEIKQIKELMATMGRTGMKRLMLKREGFEIQLERQDNGKVVDPMIDSLDDMLSRQEVPAQRLSSALGKQKELSRSSHRAEETQEDVAGIYVTSPMVGTYYASSSPEDAPFVKVGDKIEKHTVVCIIEAMKVMNEVKSGVAGTIAEVLVENGHPVEFGTKLFKII